MDIRTILYVNLFLLTGCMVALAVIAFHDLRFRNFRWLAVAYAAGGFGTFLRMQQGRIPDFFSLVTSNVMLVAALLLVHRSFVHFVGANAKMGWQQSLLLLSTFGGLVYYSHIHPSFRARSLLMSLAYLVLAAMSA